MKSIVIFEFTVYKEYVLTRVQSMPKSGHGQFIKMARHIRASPVIVTQVLKGDRNFSEEQAFRLANYFGLTPIETEYFMGLLAWEKAGSAELRDFHAQSLNAIRNRARDVKNRIGSHGELDDMTKSVFYSDWVYSAVRNITSIPSYRAIDAIAERLSLDRARVSDILEFLLQTGLCKKDSAGWVEPGVVTTHLDAQSRFVNNHHRNWRLKALESLSTRTPEDFYYSFPCTISNEDLAAIKSQLLDVISDLAKRIPKTDPATLACLNIDWFKV